MNSKVDLSREWSSGFFNIRAPLIAALRVAQLEQFRKHWMDELRTALLEIREAQELTPEEMDYGGAAGACANLSPIQEKADQARMMIARVDLEEDRRKQGVQSGPGSRTSSCDSLPGRMEW